MLDNPQMSEDTAKLFMDEPVRLLGSWLAARCGDQPSGGARRDRTDDLMLAKHALSQLSYSPVEAVGSRQLAVVRLATEVLTPTA
jgi:hypothetical protein